MLYLRNCKEASKQLQFERVFELKLVKRDELIPVAWGINSVKLKVIFTSIICISSNSEIVRWVFFQSGNSNFWSHCFCLVSCMATLLTKNDIFFAQATKRISYNKSTIFYKIKHHYNLDKAMHFKWHHIFLESKACFVF